MTVRQATTRIALAGATGRTGNAVAHGLVGEEGVELVACIAPSLGNGAPTRPVPSAAHSHADVSDITEDVDVLVDITRAEAALRNLEWALEHGVNVVLGTTGIPNTQLEALGERFAERDLHLLYVPNFSIGAVLMMRFAAEAARLLPDVEIVELHHAGKADAPSGTARRTAELVAAAGGHAAAGADAPARGELVDGVPVHSVRLPGALAHQEVLLGAPGELLTIRHDAFDRGCYAAGVAHAARKVASCPPGLTIGLEHVL